MTLNSKEMIIDRMLLGYKQYYELPTGPVREIII